MGAYLCTRVASTELQPVSDERKYYEVGFTFHVVPHEYRGRADEAQHSEQRRVRLMVADDALGTRLLRDGSDKPGKTKRDKVLYWYARCALERGDKQLDVTRDYVFDNKLDTSKVEYPPNTPFNIDLVQKMGFHSRRD